MKKLARPSLPLARIRQHASHLQNIRFRSPKLCDGNGRIAHAITDLLLARPEGSSQRFYSMSARIRDERNAYYDIREATQKNGLDVAPWLEWFLGYLDRAFDGAEGIFSTVLQKAKFWEAHSGEQFNPRQRLMINRIIDGLEEKLTTSK